MHFEKLRLNAKRWNLHTRLSQLTWSRGRVQHAAMENKSFGGSRSNV
jgi:hypothetical protein